MNFLYFLTFIFFILISCSNSEKEIVDVDAFLNRGKKIDLLQSKNNLINKNIIKINKINLNNKANKKEIYSWSQEFLNSQNLISQGIVDLDKIKKSVSENIQKVIFFQNKVVGIDTSSNLFVFDENLKILKKKRIYKRKLYGDYNLKFSLGYVGGKIIVSDNIGNIQAFDSKNLDRKWINNLSAPFRSEIKIYNENIYLINSNSKIFSINSKDGAINWSYETSSEIIKGNFSYQIAVSNNKLLFLNDSGEVYCLDLIKKNILWSFVIDKEIFANTPLIIKSTPFLIKNDFLFFSTNFGSFFSVNINNGEIIWKKDISVINKIYLFDDMLFLTKDRNLIILSYKDGKILFNKNFSYFFKSKNIKNTSFEDLYLGNKYLYLFSKNGYVIKILKNDLNVVKIEKLFSSFDNYIFFKKKVLFFNKKSLIIF